MVVTLFTLLMISEIFADIRLLLIIIFCAHINKLFFYFIRNNIFLLLKECLRV